MIPPISQTVSSRRIPAHFSNPESMPKVVSNWDAQTRVHATFYSSAAWLKQLCSCKQQYQHIPTSCGSVPSVSISSPHPCQHRWKLGKQRYVGCWGTAEIGRWSSKVNLGPMTLSERCGCTVAPSSEIMAVDVSPM